MKRLLLALALISIWLCMWLDLPAPRVFAQQRTSPSSAVIGNNSVGFTQLATSVLQVATVSVSSAQYLAMNTTPITLVAAQGAGTVIDVEEFVVDYVYGGTAYAGGSGSSLYLNSGGSIFCSNNSYTNGIINGQTSNIVLISTACSSGSSLSSAILNVAIVLKSGAAVTTGNGTFTFIVYYRVITGLS